MTATVREIREQIGSGARTATEVVRGTLDRIERLDPALHAFITVTADHALARAADLDRDRSAWKEAPLLGVPIALKDNFSTRGIRTTAGSKILEQYVPAYDATVVARLARAGAVVVGKTNCDEFAMGSSTENSAFGPTRNPWAPDSIPGGSSGGSAVAVAARLSVIAFGSDTGGSIRQPASLCGIVGLKPTYGRVSRFGLLAFASSLDQIGPMTCTAYDAALAMNTIAGHDPADATSSAEPVPDYTAGLTGEVRGLRIGVPAAMLADGVDDQVLRAFRTSLDTLADRGATLVDIDLPHAKHAIGVYYLLATAEASSNLARYDGVKYGFRAAAYDGLVGMYARTREAGFGLEVKRRIMLGTYALSAGYYDAYYLKAQQVRTLVLQDYDRAFERVDVVATPTSPTAAFKLGERVADPLQMYLADVFTVSVNLAGLPAISIPCGFTTDQRPIGLQLIGRRFEEGTLLRAADAYEREVPWHLKEPEDPRI